MRTRAFSKVAIGAVIALAITSSLAGSANAEESAAPQGMIKGASGAAPSTDRLPALCAGNLGAPNGDGLTAQEFGPDFAGFATWGAADFNLTTRCRLKRAYIYGSATSPDLFGTSVNASIGSGAAAPGTPTGCTVVGSNTVPPSGGTVEIWRIRFGSCTLGPGHYWLVAQVVKDFGTSGQWFWNTTDARAYSAPNDEISFGPDWGLAPSCTNPAFDTTDTCLGLPYDYLFKVGKRTLRP